MYVIIGAAVPSIFCNFLYRVTHRYPHSFHYFENPGLDIMYPGLDIMYPGLDIRKLMTVVNQSVLVLVSPNDGAVDEGMPEFCGTYSDHSSYFDAPCLLNAPGVCCAVQC